MKTTLLLAILLLSAASFSYGQCGKKVLWMSSKTEFFGSDSSLQRTDTVKTILEFDTSTIRVRHGDLDLTGTVKSSSCDWTIPYKAGQLHLTLTLTTPDGGTADATLTIQGKGDKIVLFWTESDNPEGYVREEADRFEDGHK